MREDQHTKQPATTFTLKKWRLNSTQPIYKGKRESEPSKEKEKTERKKDERNRSCPAGRMAATLGLRPVQEHDTEIILPNLAAKVQESASTK